MSLIINPTKATTPGGTCANSPQLLCLAGRTGTTNDPTISSDGDGTITGSAASGKRLLLQANPLQDAPIAIEYPGRRATYTDGPNEQIYGAAGDPTANNVTMTIVNDGPSQPLSVSVVGQAVTIHLATDSGGTITTTVGDLFTFINTDAAFVTVPPGGVNSTQVPSFVPTDLASTLVTQTLTGFSSGGHVIAAPLAGNAFGRLDILGGDPVQPTFVVEGAGAGQTADLAQILCTGYGLVVTAKGIVRFINDDNEHVTEWYANDGADLAFQMDGDGTARFTLAPVVVSDLGGGGLRPVFADNAGTLVPGNGSAVGPPGMDGLDGIDGLDGMPGPQGATGVTGATGPQGLPGMDGLDGLDGMDGLTGSTGPMGATGATGAQGIQGLPGLDGLDGTDGFDGLTGSTGPQGPQGVQGATGFDGADGTDGLDGLTGSTGPQGIQGIQGTIGFDGLDGADGFDGLQGSTGPQGKQGIQGPVGFDGDNGLDGFDGLTGSTGPQGIQGLTGAIGFDGADGADGLDGLTGSTGPQGIQGIPGPADLAYDPTLPADEPFTYVPDLHEYFFNPGRVGGQTAIGGVASGDSHTIRANAAALTFDNVGIVKIDDTLLLSGTSRSSGAGGSLVSLGNTPATSIYTFTNGGNPIGYNFSGEIKHMTVAPPLGLSPAIFASNGIVRMAVTASTIPPQLATCSTNAIADGVTWTLSTRLFGVFADGGGFNTANGGSVVGSYPSFTANPTWGAGVALTEWDAFQAINPVVAGGATVGTMVAFDVGTWSRATNNLSLRSTDTGATLRHSGNVRLGDQTAPTNSLEVTGQTLLYAGNAAVSAGANALTVNAAFTLSGLLAPFKLVQMTGTVTDTALGVAQLFSNLATYDRTTTTNLAQTTAVTTLVSTPTIRANGVTLTGGAYVGWSDGPIFGVANSGVLTGQTVAAFSSGLTVGASTTVATRQALVVADATGAGAVTTQVGVDMTLAKGTTNITVRSQSAGAYAQHLGAVVQGQDPGSFTVPTGYFAQFPTLILATGEVATVQGTGILQVH